MEIKKIEGVIKEYAWANDYFIPSLLKREKKPIAEYWMGVHSAGEAKVVESEELLSKHINNSANALPPTCSSFPLLFKILAIKKPLSLQCHPNKEQAEEGWKREEESRKSGNIYNYQDSNSKAELLYALTPITALYGFRDLSEIEDNFNKYLPSFFHHHFSSVIESQKSLFLTLNRLSMDEKIFAIDEAIKSIDSLEEKEEDGEFLNLPAIVRLCVKEHPGDIGALAPLYMNILHLNPSEGVYLKPTTLHVYIKGNGLELMNSSDNVLRGGLTTKRVDISELERILDFSPSKPKALKTIIDEKNRSVFLTENKDFELIRLNNTSFDSANECGIILSYEGTLTIKEDREMLILKSGEAAFIPYSAKAEITVDGLAFEAVIPKER